MDDDFDVVASYTIPREILDRFRPMSSSGSWGPDGRLWITGHDLGEAYVLEPPAATVGLPGVEGQGIAWDLHGSKPALWTIKRSTKQVLQFNAPYREISEPAADDWQINGPEEFQRDRIIPAFFDLRPTRSHPRRTHTGTTHFAWQRQRRRGRNVRSQHVQQSARGGVFTSTYITSRS